ncbi:MAG: class I SAM-dependent methyltransferase [Candidatus Thorarchaeota archaeon]
MDKTSVYEPPQQTIELERILGEGNIIDIGGGGEGLVSRIEGIRVYAVDVQMDEILEARIHNPPSNWIVADAINLPFGSNTFDIATLWFSLGYMKEWSIKKSVFQDIYRVLKKGGGINIKAIKIDCQEDMLVFRADYSLPDGTLSRTGYGVKGKQNQTVETVTNCLRKTGFVIDDILDFGHWFSLEGSKSLKSRPIV